MARFMMLARVLARNRPGLGTTLFASFGAGWLYVALERLDSAGAPSPAEERK